MQESKRAKLSKAILDMKFMKKTRDRVLKEEEDAEGQDMYANEITDEMRKSGNIIFVETGIFHCKDLIEGRLSFGGMNPDVEKLMQEGYTEKLTEANLKKEQEVTDVEMAKGYSSLIDNMGKKFQNKKNKNFNVQHKKKKFRNN
ncbi:M-phase phosphoprotein 6 [Onthophagus taurus]|uniref:M-phase phosphoprotein 6 n=1 Tax=Onthophagus taurus TaxID=166361 RepID=UPI000C20A091|nr:M-phase phosphoprotein 6 [Onthophagus taurus]